MSRQQPACAGGQDVHVVGHTANHDGRTILPLANPGQISVSRFPEGDVLQEGAAFLSGKK
jgi:hypothetical protein